MRAVSAETGSKSTRYVAEPGDTVYSICRQNHITVEQFSNYNPGVDVNKLPTGASVKIKAGGRTKHKAKVSVTEVADTTAERASVSTVPKAQSPALPPARAAAKPGSKVQSIDRRRSAPKPAPKQKDTGYLAYSDPVNQHKDSEPSVAGSLVRIVLALVFVAALAYASLLALKRFMTKKVPGKSSRQRLRYWKPPGWGPTERFILSRSTASASW